MTIEERIAALEQAAVASRRPVERDDCRAAKEIRASTLVLEDKEGRPRVLISADAQDGPFVSLADQGGTSRIVLGLFHTAGPVIQIADEAARPRTVLTCDGPEDHSIGLVGRDGKPRLLVNLVNDKPVVRLIDADGRTRAKLGLDGNYDSSLELFGRGVQSAKLSVEDDEAQLSLFGDSPFRVNVLAAPKE